jgi:hypothetical protein
LKKKAEVKENKMKRKEKKERKKLEVQKPDA